MISTNIQPCSSLPVRSPLENTLLLREVLKRHMQMLVYVWPGRNTLSGKLAVLTAFGKFCVHKQSQVPEVSEPKSAQHERWHSHCEKS